MPTLSDTETTTELALAFQPTGFEEIPGSTILTRLNYYDGKFLRADDLQLEQNYLRRLAELGARAGGSGLVYGFDVFLGSGDALTIGGGLGFDPAGRVLYLPGSFSTALQSLVDATARTSPEAFALSEGTNGFAVCLDDAAAPTPSSGGAEYYLITIAHAEEACGDEEVFGKLCDDGCATSTDRAYLVEGVVVRARPYRPTTPFATSRVVQLTETHLRSLLVSAAFADEKLVVPSLISKAGLLSGPWCTGAAAPTGWEVPIAVVGVLSSSRFVDEWIVRRERMDTPPRRYWAWTMAMRPWEAYLAQILQFQCQLPSALSGPGGSTTGTDPCADQRAALGEAVRYLGQLSVAVEQPPADTALVARDVAAPATETALSTDPGAFLTELGGIAQLQNLQLRLTDIYKRVSAPSSRILVDGGIVELPPAGYLPVTPGSTTPVDEQVRRLMGEGVDLRFCVTTPDYIPHALEKAQHMERISLIQGLDNPANKPPVDVLVPGGTIGTAAAAMGWDARIALRSALLNVGRTARTNAVITNFAPMLSFQGMARSAPTATGAELAVAAPGTLSTSADTAAAPALSGYSGASVDVDPFTLGVGGVFNVAGEAALAVVPAAGTDAQAEQMQANGSARLTVVSPSQQTANGRVLTASGTLHADASSSGATSNSGSTSVDVLVKIEETSTNPPTYAVTVTQAGQTDGGGVLLSATWSGSPLVVDAFADSIQPAAAGTVLEEAGSVPHLVTAELTEDSDVFNAANPLNVAAHQALQTLADALQDDRYTGSIADTLFDPSAQGGQASGITATQDWVLFHRRRHKDCQTPQVAPPVASKTYGVYVASTRSAATLARAVTALANDDSAIVQKLFKAAGTVTFAGGTANLTTAQQTILDAWNATKPLGRIADAVIATDETDETVSLLQSRIVAYQTAVSSVSTPNADESLSNRTTLSSLPSGGVDGQIALITTVPPTICHHVYVAPPSSSAAEVIADLQTSLGIDTFLERYSQELTDLGTIVFDDLTANVESSALTLLVNVGFGGNVAAYMIVPEAGTSAASAAEPLTAQAQAILNAVGGDPANATIETAPAAGNVQTWPSDCPVVSVFVATQD